ncbi:MAG: endonuclease/exonuclease/phosphatase family protein [Bacteroidales bacterium]|nr:endonuclease/exonuclease/phosphatase family protein [Bacteroidales bacterium]
MLYTYLKEIYDLTERKRTIDHLVDLRAQLDAEIPEKTAENTLLLATWNIRQFNEKRRKESLMYIAEILSRFDLIAVQEVKDDMAGLMEVMRILGKNWTFIATDISSKESGGNNERIAFVYDTNKVSFKNIAGEVVLPHTELIQGMQFARTPFCVAFQAGWFKFYLTTVHIYYGDEKDPEKNERRQAEIKAIGKFLAGRAESEKASYIVLGDFNIPAVGDEYMDALESTGFTIPDAIKEHPTNFGKVVKHYDQIAFKLKLEEGIRVYDEDNVRSGAFNFTKSVYKEEDYEEYIDAMKEKTKVERTGEKAQTYFRKNYRIDQMSDHMPLWLELKVDFSSPYIKKQKTKALSLEAQQEKK